MNLAEKILVVIDQEISYNLCDGGHGGFGFINRLGINIYKTHLEKMKENFSEGTKCHIKKLSNTVYRDSWRNKISETWNGKYKEGYSPHFLCKKHSEETKKKIGTQTKISQQGENNSQFGTCWINNCTSNKKIKKDDIDKWIILGYNKGRII